MGEGENKRMERKEKKTHTSTVSHVPAPSTYQYDGDDVLEHIATRRSLKDAVQKEEPSLMNERGLLDAFDDSRRFL